MENKMTLTDRINAIDFATISAEDFAFLKERALKSVRKGGKPAVRKPSKAHEALVAMIPQVDAFLADHDQVGADDLGISPQRMTALAKVAGLVKVDGTGKGKVKVAYTRG